MTNMQEIEHNIEQSTHKISSLFPNGKARVLHHSPIAQFIQRIVNDRQIYSIPLDTIDALSNAEIDSRWIETPAGALSAKLSWFSNKESLKDAFHYQSLYKDYYNLEGELSAWLKMLKGSIKFLSISQRNLLNIPVVGSGMHGEDVLLSTRRHLENLAPSTISKRQKVWSEFLHFACNRLLKREFKAFALLWSDLKKSTDGEEHENEALIVQVLLRMILEEKDCITSETGRRCVALDYLKLRAVEQLKDGEVAMRAGYQIAQDSSAIQYLLRGCWVIMKAMKEPCVAEDSKMLGSWRLAPTLYINHSILRNANDENIGTVCRAVPKQSRSV